MSTKQDLDTALALFNDGLSRQRREHQAKKALETAERAKQEAAATLKRLQADGSAGAEDRAAADAAYRESVAAFNRLRNGEGAEDPGATDEAAGDDTPTGDEPTVEAQTSEDASGDADDASAASVES